MKLDLKEEPKKPIIIEGFPGFGFVGTICTEFLIKHLDAKKIGKVISENIKPVAAIHEGEVIDPLEVYYDDEHNIIILRALSDISGSEWELASIIEELSKKLNAKEVLSLEGVAGDKEKGSDVFYFTNKEGKEKELEDADMEKLEEGLIKGVTASLILQMEELDISFSSIFVKAHPKLPDSKAAGEVVKALDSYLDLKVDYKPLMKTAEKMEKQLKKLAKQAEQARKRKQSDEEKTTYLG